MNRLLFLAIIALGCRGSINEGTIVGNPGDGMIRLGVQEDITLTSATTHLGTVEAASCTDNDNDVQWSVYTIDADIDLAQGTIIDLPTGDFCEFQFVPDAPIVATGTGPDNATFELTINSIEWAVGTERFRVAADTSYVLQVGSADLMSAAGLGLVADTNTVIDPTSPIHADLVTEFRQSSLLARDSDASGTLDPDEPIVAAGANANVTLDPFAETDPGTSGCGNGQNAGLLLVLPLFLIGRRRYSSRP